MQQAIFSFKAMWNNKEHLGPEMLTSYIKFTQFLLQRIPYLWKEFIKIAKEI